MFELMEKFDASMASTEVDFSTYDAGGVDFNHIIQGAIQNHIGRRRNRNEMDEKYGKGT